MSKSQLFSHRQCNSKEEHVTVIVEIIKVITETDFSSKGSRKEVGCQVVLVH